MDLLSQRYANPYFILNGYIATGRFCFFIEEFFKTYEKDVNSEKEWEFYLHKVFDLSFGEWKEECDIINRNKNMTDYDFKTTVNIAMNMLKKEKD